MPVEQMFIATQPGFFDLDDSQVATAALVADDTILKLNHDSKFGIVRCEIIFMGYYIHGNTVGVPQSPVDGYNYQQSEVQYIARLVSTRVPAIGFQEGQESPPGIASGQVGADYYFNFDIDDFTGKVSISRSYFQQGKLPETVNTDGVVKVTAVCQRSSINVHS